MRCTRFLNILRTTWLVAKRNRCPCDLRRLLVNTVAKRLFAWETEQLIKERIHSLWFAELTSDVNEEIASSVEVYDHDLLDRPHVKLTRVLLRRRYFSALQYEWVWLEDLEPDFTWIGVVVTD